MGSRSAVERLGCQSHHKVNVIDRVPMSLAMSCQSHHKVNVIDRVPMTLAMSCQSHHKVNVTDRVPMTLAEWATKATSAKYETPSNPSSNLMGDGRR